MTQVSTNTYLLCGLFIQEALLLYRNSIHMSSFSESFNHKDRYLIVNYIMLNESFSISCVKIVIILSTVLPPKTTNTVLLIIFAGDP